MAKNAPKTIRFTPLVESYIESWAKGNFSENLHLMVNHFKDQEVFYNARLEKLKKQIEEKEERLREMESMMRDVRWLDAALGNLKKDIEKSRNCFDEFVRRNTKEDGAQELEVDNCITPEKYRMKGV